MQTAAPLMPLLSPRHFPDHARPGRGRRGASGALLGPAFGALLVLGATAAAQTSTARANAPATGVAATPAAQAPQPWLTIDDVLRNVGNPKPPPRVEFNGEQELLVGSGEEQRRLDLRTFAWIEKAPAAAAEQPEATAETAAEGEPAEQKRPWRRSGEGLSVLVTGADGKSDYAALEIDRSNLPETAGEPTEISPAPSSDRLAFVLGGDLFVAPLDGTGPAKNLTSDGDPDLLDGVLDWVYQEEIYGRGDFRGYWWSPDGKALCWLRLDEHQVPSFTVVDHVPPEPRDKQRGVVVEATRYPKVGEPNPTASLHLCRFDAAGAPQLSQFDLSSFDADCLIVRVDWAADSSGVWFTVQDRIQTRASLCFGDAASGKVRRVIEERSATWVNRPEAPHFLKDGSFLWLSERTGFNHIYHYAQDGALIRPLTQGDWQVRRIERVDEEQGQLWFEGTRDGAINRNLYRVPLAGGEALRITAGPGQHSLEFSPDGRLAVDTVSSLNQPATLRLIDALTGEVRAELGQASRGEGPERGFVDPLLLEIPGRDGLLLDATLLLPPGHGSDAAARYPIFLDTYSGPDAPTVANRFRPSAWLQFLAQRGAIVLQVNVRTASGRGQAFTGLVYRRFLEPELADLESAVDFVLERYQGDPSRVAISGWSYGGSITAYALTHSEKFTLGFAGAGVYDWRLYDTIYTERYMQTPELNPEGYKQSSVIESAANLKGHLVLLHGTTDDNVHLQNTIQLVDELQKAGKQNFELMLYPNARHGVNSKHRLPYMWGVIKRQFGLEDPPSAG